MKRGLLLTVLLASAAPAWACPDLLNTQLRPLAGEGTVDLCQRYAGQVRMHSAIRWP